VAIYFYGGILFIGNNDYNSRQIEWFLDKLFLEFIQKLYRDSSFIKKTLMIDDWNLNIRFCALLLKTTTNDGFSFFLIHFLLTHAIFTGVHDVLRSCFSKTSCAAS